MSSRPLSPSWLFVQDLLVRFPNTPSLTLAKKVVKEKVFHIIWEKDSELTNDEDTISEKTDLSDDDDLSKN